MRPTRATRSILIFILPSILAFVAGCTSGSGSSNSGGGSNPSVTASVSPAGPSVRVGATQQFTATVNGSSNQAVTWFVNSVSGGNATVGTISSGGMYQAPAAVPNPTSVTVAAVTGADPSVQATSTVAIQNPVPVLSGVNPTSFPTGSFSLAITGSGFVTGAQVLFSGTPLATTFVSSTQLTAGGTANSAGTFGVTVANPNPGASTSGSINVTVTNGSNPPPPPPPCSAMSAGQGASLNGFLPFPADNPWNQNIAAASVDPNSAAIINFIGTTVPVHPDFGSGLYNGSSIGIPYVIVGAAQPFVDINLTAYGDESDPGPMPIPSDAPIEGYPAPGNGDRHVLVLDNNNCWLYELYNSAAGTGTSWNADSAAVWDLLDDEQRPWTWTSADAAGLSIFAGLIRYDEVANGAINHAIRFTLQNSRAAMVPPASHWAANSTNANAAPMGMRMRLKSSFNISGFSAANQVILTALKQYGMIMADNGSSMYISGAPDDRWSNDDLHNLTTLTSSDFEVVQMNPIYMQANFPQGAAPTITSFTASSTSISSGTQITLSWSATGAGYFIVSPQIGAVRGPSVSLTPTQTTTYTLYATNQFGRSTASVTVTVQ
jgi:hypothetical protein